MPEQASETRAAIDMESWVCPAPLRDAPNIVMGHGGGGAMSAELIEHLFLPAFGSAADAGMGDSAIVDIGGARLAFSTDSFVVKPMVFPGGTIGDLAVNGTVNDLAMAGAAPAVLSTAFILEEGTPLDELARVAQAVGTAAWRPGSNSSPATPRSSTRGTATASTSTLRASGSSTSAPTSDRSARHQETR